MKVALSLDDFSIVNNRLDLLLRLRERYRGLRVSLFTVPRDERNDWGAYLIRDELLRQVKKCLDWIQIIPHGLTHRGSEMRECDYYFFKNQIMPKIKEAFEKDGLPFVRGFKAPHWRWSQGVVRALNEEGWWGAVDRRQPNMLCPDRFYRYSHCLDEPFLGSIYGSILKLHGHAYGTSNDLGKCFDKLMSLPLETEWHFVTDFLEGK